MKKYNFINEKLLVREYIRNKKSPYKLAKELECVPNTIRYYLKKHKIKIRNKSEAQLGELNPTYIDGRTNKKNYCKDCGKELSKSGSYNNCKRCLSCSRIGELHWNWLAGDTKKGYTVEFSKELKESIRERDNHECQICHKTTKEHLQQFGVDLYIHHIDYDKKNCKEENLISLCNSCHMKTNYNRQKWIECFERQLNQEELTCQKN